VILSSSSSPVVQEFTMTFIIIRHFMSGVRTVGGTQELGALALKV
jgi:hypothetical protein